MLSDNVFNDNKNNSFMEKFLIRLTRIYRNKFERYTIYPKTRWSIFIVIFILYVLRVLQTGGFYVVSYIFGLYLLHLAVQFFTPLGIPEADEEDDNMNETLPMTINDQEDKPLIRSMNEFRFWQNCTLAAIISIFCTSSQLFDLPVFWPFLLAYFIMLFVLTVKRQIKHMVKWRYSVFDFNRKSTK